MPEGSDTYVAPIGVDPSQRYAEIAQNIWSDGLSQNDSNTRGITMPIAFTSDCVPVSGSEHLPKLDLDCIRTNALEQESLDLAVFADTVIKDTPAILEQAIRTNRVYDNIPIMQLSEGTLLRLRDAIAADEYIQNQSPWPTNALGWVDQLEPRVAFESLHGEEQRVLNYLTEQGLRPFLEFGNDYGVRISVRLFATFGDQ
jgi:hypothetical protein